MPNNQGMREELKRVYPFGPWHEKVKRMSDQQVFAVYKRLIADKKK